MKPTCSQTRKLILHHVDVVRPNGIDEDSGIIVEDGIITCIGTVDSSEDGEHINGCHHLVMPGFIDLHSDALEKYIEPRAGSAFPLGAAILEFDKTLAACGITTMYHCICFSHDDARGRELRTNQMALVIINELIQLKTWLRVNTKHHIRFDILNNDAIPIIKDLIDQQQVDLLSFMDHTPGQGQYRDTELYRHKVKKEWNLTDDHVATMIKNRMRDQKRIARDELADLAEKAILSNVVLASHDDDGAAKVAWAKKLGSIISEFPVCHEAIEAAKDGGLWTVFGAPNVLRGQSQSGNLSATEVVLSGKADILASDYSPMSLLHAVFKLHYQDGYPLHEAVRLVTLNPAKAAGIATQTGSIEVGKKADLILVNGYAKIPHVTTTITNGQITYSTNCPGISEKAA